MTSPTKEVFRKLCGRIIAYHPIYVKLTGSTTSAVALSQLLFWFDRLETDQISKMDEEIMRETSLTPNELRRVKRDLKELSFLEIIIQGIPAKTWYRIDWDRFLESLNGIAQVIPKRNTTKQDWGNPPNKIGEIHQHSLVESTKLSLVDLNKNMSSPAKTAGESPCLTPSELKQKLLRHPRWKSFATKLYFAVKQLHKIERSSMELSGWAKQFFLLYSANKVEVARIRKVLDWYCPILPLKEPYMPEAHCGKTFREKFVKLEQRMKKGKGSERDSEEPVEYSGEVIGSMTIKEMQEEEEKEFQEMRAEQEKIRKGRE